MTRRRVAITGVGMVSPVGNDAATCWANLRAGNTGVAEIKQFDASGFSTRIGAEVKNFDATQIISDRKLLKYALPSHRFALVAAEEALSDAGIRPGASDGARWGLSLGAGMYNLSFDEFKKIDRYCSQDGEFKPDGLVSPDFPNGPVSFCRGQTNTGLGLLAKYFGIEGYATCVHTACASGGQAIGAALRAMRRGLCDRVLAGGFDSMIHPIGISGFCLLGALSTDNETPSRASRPFDLTRNGFVLGEGAGFLVLEDWDAARARGAKIYAELAGNSDTLSCYRITDSPPDGDGPIQAMRQSIADAGITPADIDYVNAHGTSTQMNDKSECAALRVVMAGRIGEVAVSSTKSCMGHLIAAAGAVEGVVCALAIRDGIAPLNANYTQPDPECAVNIISGQSRPIRIRAALSNSLGFGGSNNCLVFRNPEEVP